MNPDILGQGWAILHSSGHNTWLVGFNAEQDDVGNNGRVNDPPAGLKQMPGYSTTKGSSECIPAWRGRRLD